MTKLVTIATFDEGAKARIAQNALLAAGIQAAVADETLIAMDWLLSNAVGGVKVQVRDEDAERAVAVLNESFGDDGLGPAMVDPKEALAAKRETEPPDDDDDEDPPEPTADAESREETSRRMVFTSLLALVLPPVAFYALYLFLNTAFGEGALSSRGRLNLWIGGACTLVGLFETLAWLVFFS